MKDGAIKFLQLIILLLVIGGLLAFAFLNINNKRVKIGAEPAKKVESASNLSPKDAKEFKKVHKTIMLVLNSKSDSKEEVNKAIEALEALVKLDYAPAQNDLGMMHLQGIAMPVNKEKAAYWVSRSAKQKNPEALYNLATMYMFGDGFKKNPDKALKILKSDLLKDYDDALATLGLVYIDGSMAEKDVEKGINYFQTAAKKGHVDSMFRLGMIYYQGDLVMKNLKQAHLWFTEAAAKGYKPAKEILSKEIFQTLRK